MKQCVSLACFPFFKFSLFKLHFQKMRELILTSSLKVRMEAENDMLTQTLGMFCALYCQWLCKLESFLGLSITKKNCVHMWKITIIFRYLQITCKIMSWTVSIYCRISSMLFITLTSSFSCRWGNSGYCWSKVNKLRIIFIIIIIIMKTLIIKIKWCHE